jgi:hypothetical protein
MHTLTRRGIRLAVMTLGFAGLLIAVNAVPGAATPAATGFVPTPLAHGKLAQGTSLKFKAGLQIVVQRNDIASKAYSGWHSHPGGAIIVIQSGQLTTYRAVKNSSDEEEGRSRGAKYHCVITNYKAGDAFVEGVDEVLDAKNNGMSATVVYATFPSVPVDSTGKTLQRTDRPDPGVCPSIATSNG